MQIPLILIVDDDTQIQELIRELLERHKMRVISADNVKQAEQLLSANKPDLVLLDVMMPGEDGISFCRRLRHESTIPILMLSALGEDLDRVVGLEMGADDYLAKPFYPRELIARIKSLLRRAEHKNPAKQNDANLVYQFEHFQLAVNSRTLRGTKGEIALTSGEFTLLLHLIEHAPRILSRDQLLALSKGSAVNPFDRSIDTHISRLRAKLEQNPRKPALVKTIRNMGYVFAASVRKLSA